MTGGHDPHYTTCQMAQHHAVCVCVCVIVDERGHLLECELGDDTIRAEKGKAYRGLQRKL